ncbi:Imm10 family immunity protein [Laceyella putida]|uniref:Imm10 family immunity protein n=1 Tax=Laceyella putida TaxID=110101 RepID=A0ABW2RM13_9BACL
MTTKLKGNALCMQVEEGVIQFGFADDEFDVKEYLLLSRSFEIDDQDRELRLEGVHIEWGDQLRSAYGGVEAVILSEHQVIFKVDRDTAVRLGTEETIEIEVADARYYPKGAAMFLARLFGEENGVTITYVG